MPWPIGTPARPRFKAPGRQGRQAAAPGAVPQACCGFGADCTSVAHRAAGATGPPLQAEATLPWHADAPMDFDLAVIGAGSAGLSVAAVATQLGARVALVERGPMGGDCLNTGCVPSKALLAAAHAAR